VGRLPDSLSTLAGAQQVVVDRTLARRLWADSSAVGRRISEQREAPVPPGLSPTVYEVVGVVEDIQMPGRRAAAGQANLYTAIPARMGHLPIVLRTALPESEIVSAFRATVAAFDPELRASSGMPFGAIVQSFTMGEAYWQTSLAPTRFAMALLVAFSMVALLLSGVGLYGVIAYSVSRRTQEIGVRVALGADRTAVQRMVMGDGLRLTALGLVIGIGAGLAATRLLSGLLFGVSPADPASFATIATLVLGIALLACWIPARRALRIDPMEALRAE
jgi:putative ABC transport system permease protein